jgi:hypothetical protein
VDVLTVVEPEIVATSVQSVETLDVIRTELLAVEVLAVEMLNGSDLEVITDTVKALEAIERTETEIVTDQQVRLEIITVGIQGPPGGLGFEEDAVYAKRVDMVGDTLIYRGEAAVGSAESAPAWRIRRITFVGDDVAEEWADGTAAFSKSWSGRAGYTYL